MKKTILLVEDSKVQTLVCESILHEAGYLVLFAQNGEEALHLARESAPDLILLDLLLPGIGGEEVLHELKRDRETQRIPIIVLSQLPATLSARLKAAGAACYFQKLQLNDDEGGQSFFLATVDRVLQESAAQPSAREQSSLEEHLQRLQAEIDSK